MTGRILCGFLFVALLVSSAVADDAAEIEEKLEELGVRVSSAGMSLAAESELSRAYRDATQLRRNVVSAEKKHSDFRKGINRLDAQIGGMNQRSTQLNPQLANVRDVATNNRLVGAINALDAQMRLAYQQKERMVEQEAEFHQQVSRARDEYLTHLRSMNELVGQTKKQYVDTDREIVDLIRQYNEASGESLALAPTSGFDASVRRYEKLSGEVYSGEIALRRDRNTYWAGVSINGEVIEMIVDSGASVIALPYEDALKVGVKPGRRDPDVRIQVADGRVITGKSTKIDLVRVGEFTATDVECVVLGAEATNAEPLLGMTFLGNFKFEIDAGKSTLKMTQFGSEDGSSSTRRSARSQSDEEAARTVFPNGDFVHLENLSLSNLKVDSTFSVDGRVLVSPNGQSTAMKVADIVSDFEMTIQGEFSQRGVLYFLIGWDLKTSSGLMIYHDQLSTSGRWKLMEIEDGAVFSVAEQLASAKIGSGMLRIAIDSGELSIEFNGNSIVSDYNLEQYRPGYVVLGTKPNRYRGKEVRIQNIAISETTAEAKQYEKAAGPSADDFAKAQSKDLLKTGSVGTPDHPPIIGSRSGNPISVTATMEVSEDSIKSSSKPDMVVELAQRVDDFELTVSGDFSARGRIYFLVGWDQETSTGFRLDHEQASGLNRWTFFELVDGAVQSETDVADIQIGRNSTVTLRVKDSILSIEVDGQTAIGKFRLKNYQPGSIILGSRSGRAVTVDSVKLREL